MSPAATAFSAIVFALVLPVVVHATAVDDLLAALKGPNTGAQATTTISAPQLTAGLASQQDREAQIAELQRLVAILTNKVATLIAEKARQTVVAPAPVTSPQSDPAATTISRTLLRGMKGEDVRQVQLDLIASGHLTPDAATGFFGSLTEAAVKAYQRESGIVVLGTPQTTGYGAIGPRTRAAIARARGAFANANATSETPSPIGQAPAEPSGRGADNSVPPFTGGGGTAPSSVVATGGGGGGGSGGDGRRQQGGSSQLFIGPVFDEPVVPTPLPDEVEIGSATPSSCTFNGATVAHGASVTAYAVSPGAIYPAQCVTEQRTCTNAVLSGTYPNSSCASSQTTDPKGVVEPIIPPTVTDATRKSDLDQLKRGLLSYYSAKSSFLVTGAGGGGYGQGYIGYEGNSYYPRAITRALYEMQLFDRPLIEDPLQATGYLYKICTGGTKFVISAKLESPTAADLAQRPTCDGTSPDTVGGQYHFYAHNYGVTGDTSEIPSASCTFNNQTLTSGSSVTAYKSSSVPSGSTCASQKRICTNAVLSGSYEYPSCVVSDPLQCTFNGKTIAHGSPVAAYQAASVPFGSQCVSESRMCTNGTLSGTFTAPSCTQGTPASCMWEDSSVADGASINAYQSPSVLYGSSCVSEKRTCANGMLGGSYQHKACIVEQPRSCIFNGSTVQHGSGVTAYQSASVTFGSTCTSESRLCSNGSLSGSHQFSACSATSAASCSFNGAAVAHGSSVTAYQASTVPYGSTCATQTRACNNGVLSGGYTYGACSAGGGVSCTLDGVTVAHAASRTFYSASTVPSGQSCTTIAQSRACTNGTLSGPSTFNKASCAPQTASGPLRVSDYGAKCDGVIDDTLAFNNFFKAVNTAAGANGSATGIISGTCRVSSVGAHIRNPNVTIKGENNAKLLCTGTTGWCLWFGGGPTEVLLGVIPAQSVAQNSTSVILNDASRFNPNDYIRLQYRQSGTFGTDQGQLNQVLQKSGNTLTLKYPLTFPINTIGAKFSSTTRMQITSNFTISGITVDGTNANEAGDAISIENFKNSIVENLKAINFPKTSSIGLGLQIGIHVSKCDTCTIRNLTAQNVGQASIDFSALVKSTISDLLITNALGPGLHIVHTSLSNFSNVKVDGALGRASKLSGSTGNTFTNVDLRGSLGKLWPPYPPSFPNSYYANYTGFSVSESSSYNTITNLKVMQASSCVWLNGTGNNSNVFDGVLTSQCKRPDSVTGAPIQGASISVGAWATTGTIDTDNVFRNVDPGACPSVVNYGQNTSITTTSGQPCPVIAQSQKPAGQMTQLASALIALQSALQTLLTFLK